MSQPVTIRFQGPGGPTTLSVTEVGPNKIEYAVKYANGQSKGGASGPGQGCVMTLRENGSGTSCGAVSHTRPSPRPGAVVIQATPTEHGTALLRLIS
ncbi:hypothetical protein [Streptomyces sp. MH13]|uniref:hypothetical protein n=1 Tax=unclassified Streptomyces TaxID=2593676 RepID=UPI003CEBBB55